MVAVGQKFILSCRIKKREFRSKKKRENATFVETIGKKHNTVLRGSYGQENYISY